MRRRLKEVAAKLERARRETPAFAGPAPKDDAHSWVEPELVVEVRYKEWTDEGLLRQPVFLRFRDDKPVAECEMPGRGTGERGTGGRPEVPTRPSSPVPAPREVKFSNLDKVFWPDDKYTKGDLIAYYRAISPWLLPYLKDRPVVLTRYPDGIAGKSFFQKDAPPVRAGVAPHRADVERGDQARHRLLRMRRRGVAPLSGEPGHDPAACVGEPGRDARAPRLVYSRPRSERGAVQPRRHRRPGDSCAVRRNRAAACFIKSSGSTGLHVLLPLGRQCTYEQTRALGGLLARVIAAQLPEIATITRQVGKRGPRVYLDWIQKVTAGCWWRHSACARSPARRYPCRRSSPCFR